MKLFEIQEGETPDWDACLVWLRANMSDKKYAKHYVDDLKEIYRKKGKLHLDGQQIPSLDGKGKKFVSPPFTMGSSYKTSGIGLNAYDFEGITFEWITSTKVLSLYTGMDKRDGRIGDLGVLANEYMKIPTLETVTVAANVRKISGISAAFSHGIKTHLYLINAEGYRCIEIDGAKKQIRIKNNRGMGTKHYEDEFQLQEILIDAGYGDIA